MIRRIAGFAIVLATLAPSFAVAEETGDEAPQPVVSADRPSFSAGPGTVAKGHVQFELGADVGTTEEGAVLTAPQLFVRAGVNEVAELRLGVPSYSVGLGQEDPGFGTTEFSLKIGGDVTDSLSVGALPFVRFFDYEEATPIGRYSAGFLGLFSFGLTDTIGTFSNIGLAVVPGSDGGANVWELAASLGGSLAIGDAFGLYLEGFLTQADADPNVGANVGASYLVAPWLGLDAYAGAGLAGGVSDVFGGVGVSVLR